MTLIRKNNYSLPRPLLVWIERNDIQVTHKPVFIVDFVDVDESWDHLKKK